MALRYGVGMKFWELGLKNAWRDWRAGQLRLLLVAVSLAVAALTAVGFLLTDCKAVWSAMPANCSVAMR